MVRQTEKGNLLDNQQNTLLISFDTSSLAAHHVILHCPISNTNYSAWLLEPHTARSSTANGLSPLPQK